MIDWQPSAALDIIRDRAEIYKIIRHFFEIRGLMEVDTPIMTQAANPDRAIEPLQSNIYLSGKRNRPVKTYLHTSPEFAMKRLLAAGCGDIYQLCHVFRDEEVGRIHNPEFTLLEWYRTNLDYYQLMDEVHDLIKQICPDVKKPEKFSYFDIFKEHIGIDLHETSEDHLRKKADELGLIAQDCDYDCLTQALFELIVKQHLSRFNTAIVYDFPKSQAALAKLSDQNQKAQRFEYYVKGIELANGYNELADGDEQLNRFIKENEARRSKGLNQLKIDERFIAALKAGCPDCSGVAVGIDRVLMIRNGLTEIKDVLAFPFAIA